MISIVGAIVFGSVLCPCTASGDDFEAPFDSECHNVSLLQVGMKVSSTADHGVIEEDHSAFEGLVDAGTRSVAQPIRPGSKKGVKDVVSYGILVKNWYGIDTASGTCSLDAVLTLRWKDDRTEELIPNGAPALTLSHKEASTQVWLPHVEVTNIAHDGSDLISSSVKIEKGGQVTEVTRILLTVKISLDTREFPFDKQDATVNLASTTYMEDELQLKPLQNSSMWGASTGIFSNSVWNLQDAKMKSFVDDDGTLRKSRGVLALRVKRAANQYVSSIFIPSLVFMIMTWSAFWLPLGGPYVMPRVAVNAFALLCQVSLNGTANGMVPATGKAVWMLKYLELCVELQFVLMLVNVLVLSIERRPGGAELASSLDSQMILSFPCSSGLNIGVLCLGQYKVSQFLVFATLIGYLGYMSWRYYTLEKPDEDEEKK